jgi:hypothetical protein
VHAERVGVGRARAAAAAVHDAAPQLREQARREPPRGRRVGAPCRGPRAESQVAVEHEALHQVRVARGVPRPKSSDANRSG